MKYLYLILILIIPGILSAQTYYLNSSNDGQTFYTCDAKLYDEGGPSSPYTNNTDYEITFASTNNSCIRAVLKFYDMELNYDYLMIYDGQSSASGVFLDSINREPYSTINKNGNAYYAQSGFITLRITTDGATVTEGFEIDISCPDNCIPPSTANTILAGDSCGVSTPICDFNGYMGNTSSSYPTDHDYIDYYNQGIFCGGINNNSWLSFIADSTTAILDVWVRNCQGSVYGPVYGIQLQVYETNCDTFVPVSNCWSPQAEMNGQIVADGLTPGNEYMVMIDGYAKDNCEYIFAASSGMIVADAGNDQTICEGETVSLTASGGTNVVWTSSPSDPGLSGQENNTTITVSPGQTTTYTATVSGSNPNCPGTADVVVYVDAAEAIFTGLDSEYCEDDNAVTLTGNYPGGLFSGSGVSGSSFDPQSVSPGNYNVTYSYDYSVVTAFYDDFDPAPQTGWSHGAAYGSDSWTYGNPKGGNGDNSYSNDDPVIDHTSNLENNVYGQGLSQYDGDGLGGHYDDSYEWLLSPAIDCSSLSNTHLGFWRFANMEPNWDECYVQVSNDISTWHDLGQPIYPQDDDWTYIMIDISAYADGESTVYIRWTSISDVSTTYSGWNIDDVTITGVQSGGTCTSTDVQTTTVNSLPVVDAGADFSICANETANLNASVSGSVSGGTWSTSGSGYFDNAGSLNTIYNPSATDISVGSVVLTLTSDNPTGPCGQTTDNIVLTINPMDDASFSYSSGSFCTTGTNPSPSYIATSGGSFSATPAGLVINSSSGLIDLTASTVGNYTVTYTTNGTCPASSTFSVSLTTGFDAEFYYNGPFCQNDANPLPQHNTGSNGTYSSTSGLVFVNSNTGEIDLSASTPGTYSITNTISASGGCAAASHTENSITIYQAPTANAGVNDTICEGDIYALSGSVGGSALNSYWSTSGSGVFNANTYIPSGYDISLGNVTLTLTTDTPSGPCDAVSDQMILYILSAPTVNAGQDVEICENDSVQLSGSYGGSASGASWSSNGTGNFNNNYYIPSQSDISNQEVVLTYTTNDPAGPCTSVYDTIIVTINPAPLVDAGQDTSICEGENLVVSASIGGSTSSVNWYSDGTGSFDDANLTTTTYNPSLQDIQSGQVIIYIETNDPYGPCFSANDSLILKINGLPDLSVSTDSANCNQSNGSIVVTPSGGSMPYYYYWSNTSSNDSIQNNLSAGQYNITVVDDFNCSVDTTVYIYNIGSGTLQIDSLANIDCYNDSTGLIYLSVQGGTPPFNYSWSNTTSDTSKQENLPAGVYNVSITDANNCLIADSMELTQPDTALYLNSDIVDATCYSFSDGSIIIHVSGGTMPYNYSWSESALADTTLEELSAGNYIITVTDANNCMLTDTIVISQPGEIQLSAVMYKPSCNGYEDGKIQLTATGGSGNYLYVWNTDPQQQDTIATDLAGGENYTVTVTDIANDCSVIQTFDLEQSENPCLFIPNMFTPNNDGTNDKWEILGARLYKNMKVEVYNRWGDKVFTSDGYDEPWDGTVNNSYLPMGGYFYIIDLGNGEDPYTGIVTIKK